MPKRRVVFFETTSFQKKYLSLKLKKNYDLDFIPEPLSQDTIEYAKDAEIVSIFINSRIDENVLSQLPKLKYIATLSTGFDHIDLQAIKKYKVSASNVPHYGENTVAEHTFALLLAISRKILEANKRVKEGHFNPKGLTGFDLKGKTIGIVGCGSIGRHVIKMATGFEMNILGFDVYKNEQLENDFKFKYVALEYLLANSDIISLHAPYNKHTHHMINKDNIRQTKKGVVIINTSRGGLIETDALYDALIDGHVKAVGLDVLEEEKFLSEEAELLYHDQNMVKDLKTVVTNHVLINHPSVLITPHSAFNSKEAIKRILDSTIENIESFYSTSLKNVVA